MQRWANIKQFGMHAGLASRVETQGSNEDEEGLSEPSEMAEFLSELGEGDPRCAHPAPVLCSCLPLLSSTLPTMHQIVVWCFSLSVCLSVSLPI